MKKVGIICEFNPLHNGHIYFIAQVKKLYPDSILILVLGGYFLQRGDVSLISKYNKTLLALKFGVDLVLELPTLFNTNSADYFAYHSVRILNEAGIDVLVFGSETNDLNILRDIAYKQDDERFNKDVKNNLKSGLNYPTSLSRTLNVKLESNDILGVSYIKAIKKINENILINVIKRTNSFNDTLSNDDIASASNIRKRLLQGERINKFVPNYDLALINEVDANKLFELLRYKIITDNHLESYLGVDEGLENKLKKEILKVSCYDELIDKIKSKRYTKSRLKRMLIHILLGIEKSNMLSDYTDVRILGFNQDAQDYLKTFISKRLKFKLEDAQSKIEKRAALIYFELTNDESYKNEFLNKPIIFK